MKDKFYITTAIAYASKTPHIGNTYEAVLADVIARYKKLRGYDVYYLTGTDEHGQKIETIAVENGITPQQHVDKIATEVKDIWDTMNVKYDKFMRTTDEEHKNVVKKIFKKLYDNGHIYKGKYEGWYCLPDESFWTDSQLEDKKCPECGRDVQIASEEAYFFKLSNFEKEIREFINTRVYPESRRKEMINNFLDVGLQDLCVSRTSFKWGIPVDFDDNHVVYVWIDALSNYISSIGYDVDGSSELFDKLWPANLHVIGKDIVRFHTIYWPAILCGIGVELPKEVYGHPWLLTGKGKMSKSLGNTLYAKDLVEKYGVDRVRYSILREMPYADDGVFTEELLVNRTNSELVNVVGNLVNRTVTMVSKYFNGKLNKNVDFIDIDNTLIKENNDSIKKYEDYMDKYNITNAMEEVIQIARKSNKYIDETMPWILGKDESKKDRLNTVLNVLVENIRIISILISPFVPDTAVKIRNQIGECSNEYNSIYNYSIDRDVVVSKAEAIFDRLEYVEEEMEEKVEVKQEEFKEEITIDDFAKLDLRVAKVLEVQDHPKADRLYKLYLEVGNSNRWVVSGIKEYYTKEELIGKNVVLIANLKPVKLRGELSEGMLLAESMGKDVAVLEAKFASGSKIG